MNQLSQQLNESLATYFELTSQADVEIVADSSHDLSYFIDRTEFMQSLQDRILTDMNNLSQVRQDLEAMRQKLEQEKNDLAALKGQQEAKNAKLNSQQKQFYSFLNKAKANESQYQEFIKKLSAQKEQISKEIYDLRARLSRANNESYGSGTSGYPYSAIDVPDRWGFYTRECTSYAAWKWNVVLGRSFYNTRVGEGHAYNWPNLARDQGYAVVSSPRAGAIVSWARDVSRGMPYGHVAIVEGVNSDGTINVSEYNWNKYAYSERKNVRYQDYGQASFIIP